MGATFSRKRAVGRVGAGSFPSLLHETKIFAQWSMADVKELFKRFRTQVFGFALVEAQFESIMSFKESLKKHVPLDELFRILDDDHDGRIDGLELLGGLALCCQASFEEKIRFCFELYDFNLNSNLSKQEMVMVISRSRQSLCSPWSTPLPLTL
jgi:Ca2+-binding EF-hand superfamily protein